MVQPGQPSEGRGDQAAPQGQRSRVSGEQSTRPAHHKRGRELVMARAAKE